MEKPSAAIITEDKILRDSLRDLLEADGFAVNCSAQSAAGAQHLLVHKDPWPAGWSMARLRQLPESTRCLLLGSSPTDGPFLMVGLANSTYVPLPVAAAELLELLHWPPARG